MASQKKRYRIDRVERVSIEPSLNNKQSAERIALSLFKSQSNIVYY